MRFSRPLFPITVAILSAISGCQDVQSAPPNPHVSVMFSDECDFDYQANSLVFSVGNTLYRIPVRNATYFFVEDQYGYLYESYRVQIQPRDPPCFVVFGVPKRFRKVSGLLSIAYRIDESNNLVDPYEYRITTMISSNTGQMVEYEPK